MTRPLGLLIYMGRLTRTFCITIDWLFNPPYVPSVFTEHVTWWPRCYFGLASRWPSDRLVKPIAFVARFDLCICRDFGDFLFSVCFEPTSAGYHWIPKPISPFCLFLFFVSCCFLFLYFDKGESRNVNCLYLSRPEWFITFSIFDIFSPPLSSQICIFLCNLYSIFWKIKMQENESAAFKGFYRCECVSWGS